MNKSSVHVWISRNDLRSTTLLRLKEDHYPVVLPPPWSAQMNKSSVHVWFLEGDCTSRTEAAAVAAAVRDLQTPPDDDDAVSDTNEQYYSFDSEDQEQEQDVEEQHQDEELEHEVQLAEEGAAEHRTVQGRVLEEEEQVVDKVVLVEEQEEFDGDDEEEVESEEVMEVQEVIHQQVFEYKPHTSKFEPTKKVPSLIDPTNIGAKHLKSQKIPGEETRRISKRKREVLLFEEQSSQDAVEWNKQERDEDLGRTLLSIEEQDSQDASFVTTSTAKGLELNEISAEEVAECLHEKVLCETELRFSDSSEENSGKKRLNKGDKNNTDNVHKTTTHTTTKTVKEVLPALLFSDSDEERPRDDRAKKSCKKKRNVVSVETVTTTTTSSKCVTKGKEVLPDLHFSDSEEDNMAEKKLNAKSVLINSTSSVKLSGNSKALKESLPVLRFSDSEEEVQVEKVSKKSTGERHQTHKASLGTVKRRETLSSLNLSTSEEEEENEEQTLQPCDARLKEELTIEEINSDNKCEENEVDSPYVEPRTAAEITINDEIVEMNSPEQMKATTIIEKSSASDKTIQENDSLVQVEASTNMDNSLTSDKIVEKMNTPEQMEATTIIEKSSASDKTIKENDSLVQVEASTIMDKSLTSDKIVEEMNTPEQMEATTIIEKSSVSDKTIQENDSLVQVEASTTMDKSLTSDEIVQEKICYEKVDATIIMEKCPANDEAIEVQQAFNIEKSASLHKDACLNIANVSVVSSVCSINNNINNVLVEEKASTKILETSLSSPLKRRSVKPLAILDTPSKPSPHALALLHVSVGPEANEPSEIPVDHRRGKSEDRTVVTIRGTPSKARSSFAGKAEFSKLMKEGGTPISAIFSARATSEEPTSVRRGTPAKVAIRGRRLSGASTSNIIAPPEKFSDIVTPVTPLRRSSRRLGGESPIIARDVGTKGEILQTSSRIGHEESLLLKIENDRKECSLLSSVDVPIASIGRTEDKKATDTIKLEECQKTDTEALDSEMDGFESDSSMALQSTSRRGRRSSLSGVTEISSPSTPLRRSSRRSVTPSKFGSPVLDPVPEESIPAKAKRTPLKSAIKDLLNEEMSVTPKKIIDAPKELTTPSTAARRGRRKSVDHGSLTPSQGSVSEENVVSTLTPGRRTRRKSITSLEPLHVIEETSEVEEGSSTDVSPSPSGKSSRKTKRLSVAPELPPILEDLELPKIETPVKGRRSRQSSPVSEEKQVESDTALLSPTLLKSATKKAAQQKLFSRTPAKGTPLKTDSKEINEETVASASGRGRQRSSMASTSGAASTRNPRLRKSIASMKVTSGLDTPSSDEGGPRRRSTRPSPALSSSVVYQTPKAYSSDEDEEEDQESPYPPSLTEGHSEDEDEDVFNEGENPPRGTKLRPLKKASPKEQAAGGGGGGSKRRLSHASVASSTDRKSVGLKRGRESMKITELPEEEGEDVERRTKRPRRGPSAAGGRGDE